ncbi:hypothetical protein QYF36_015069 [Acer negundo]|nr:hypothetical protein QYF36_015069 [Acer negundo]
MEYPSSSDNFFHNHENQLELQPQLKFLRWLDKAAIIESTCEQNEQEKAGRLCTVTQYFSVYVNKSVICMTSYLENGFQKLNGNKRKLSLFANPLNRSGLDKYYQRLTILSFVNLCYYWFISTMYTHSSNTHAGKVCDESQSTIANVV